MDDLDLGIISSDEENATAAKVLHLLTTAWVNEKHCPTLLKVVINKVGLGLLNY